MFKRIFFFLYITVININDKKIVGRLKNFLIPGDFMIS